MLGFEPTTLPTVAESSTTELRILIETILTFRCTYKTNGIMRSSGRTCLRFEPATLSIVAEYFTSELQLLIETLIHIIITI